ncbi:MAG: hypothetical protein AAFR13_00865 [Pseudomonadota bacterium]
MSALPASAWRVLWFFAALFVITLLLFALSLSGAGPMRSMGYVEDRTPVQLVVGNDVYDVPINMIRQPSQRVPGLADRVDLIIHWPSRTGFDRKKMTAFAETDPARAQTMMLTLGKQRSLLDMPGRFEPVLKKALLANTMTEMTDGLFRAQLDPQYGFMHEVLVFSAERDLDGAPIFAARCQLPRESHGGKLLHACETELFSGLSTAVQARFPAHMISQWRALSSDLERFAQYLRVETTPGV